MLDVGRLFYCAILVVHFLVVCVVIGVLGAWFVLAALIDPTHFLPYGTAVIIVVLVIKTTHSELQAAADYLKKACRGVFDTRLAEALKKAKAEVQEEKQISAAKKIIDAAGDGMRRRQLQWDESCVERSIPEEEKKRKPSPGELFSVLDKNENGEVDLVEFRGLMQKLDIGIQPAQMEQLFAYCDVDASGSISEKEMTESWDFLVSTLMESAAQSSGVGTTDIIVTCCTLFVALVLLMCFIFLALQGWYNESSFDSMVQSGMVSLSGMAMKRVRSKVAAEGDDESIQATIGSLTQLDDEGDDTGGDEGDEGGGSS